MFTLTTRLQCNLPLKRCSVLHHVASQVSPFTSSTSRTKDAPPPPCASLSFHHDASVAVIRLNNPTRRNALTVSMMEDLDRIVQTLAKWSNDTEKENSSTIESSDMSDGGNANARVVVLTGSDEAFCSGLDLHDNESDSGEHSLKEGRNMLRHMTRVTNQLLSLPVLSVSAVSGYAVGGGAELTTCTDLVVMSRDAQIKFVHVKRGASPGWGGGRRLVKKVGRQKALRMLLLGETVTGEQEEKSGVYADAVADEGESAYDATMRLIVEPILDLPCSKSVRAIKKAVSAADADGDGDVIDFPSGMLKLDTDSAVRGEMESFMRLWGGESNRNQIQKAKERLKEKAAK